jgi:hypothetical protein
LQNTFVSETLVNFDQILKVSLLDIWRFNKEKLKQTAAAQNLKFAMKSLQTNEATAPTASAIDHAIENLKKSSSADQRPLLGFPTEKALSERTNKNLMSSSRKPSFQKEFKKTS